jgi:hypothetical protein
MASEVIEIFTSASNAGVILPPPAFPIPKPRNGEFFYRSFIPIFFTNAESQHRLELSQNKFKTIQFRLARNDNLRRNDG